LQSIQDLIFHKFHHRPGIQTGLHRSKHKLQRLLGNADIDARVVVKNARLYAGSIFDSGKTRATLREEAPACLGQVHISEQELQKRVMNLTP
jgi:hypothetical protein